jgi:deoxyribodipyrimidine photo-lyase
VLRHGPPEDELSDLAQLVGASEVLCSADSSPYARARARHVRAGLARAGAGLRTEPGLHAVDDLSTLRTQAGKPYVVFSPFHRAWLQQPRRDVLPAPRSLPPLPAGVRRGRMPSLHALGLASEAADAPAGGEAEARRRARAFLAGPVRRYPEESSRLSPYLHFGCISARELEERQTADEFRRQLAWRDFYHHVLLHHPGNARRAHQPRYRGLRWSRSRERFDAWCAGRTGFPLVDAGMRQLRREGWMPNRVRLVVGSFLTKDLWIDWRWGERWFMRHLVDGDEANNNGNWQWIASVGTDPQPPFRRIYNPARHQERLDPDGVYVRRWVSELERVPGHALAEPWRLSEDEQRTSGCMIGRDYPEPIVDHAAARREALARYAAAS